MWGTWWTQPAVVASIKLLFTIGGQAITPGGVMEQPVLWLRADADVTANAALTQVQSWGDQSPAGNDAVGDGSAVSYSVSGDGMNFNPSIVFDPTTDPDGRLGGSNPLDLTTGGELGDVTFFIVPRITDQDGGGCGDDVFNFYDDENLFELENFAPVDGCEVFTNNYTYSYFNGLETATNNTESRNTEIIGLDYSSPGGPAAYNVYGNGDPNFVNQINPYRDPLVDPAKPYSVGQAIFNRAAGNTVAPVEIGEIIAFPTVLSTRDREIVNSYLAIKYGVGLSHNYRDGEGNVIWDTDGARAPFFQ